MKRIVLFIFALFITVVVAAQSVPELDASLAETPVTIKTLSGVIAGSLVVPKNVSGKIPVILIVGDAGYTDRDGNNEKTGVTAYTYKYLANELGKSGIASVRYDKRMVGQSISSTKEKQLRIEDYNDDAVELLKMLVDDQRFSKVVLLGHGEGTLVSLLALTDQPVQGYISVEGPGEQGDKVLIDQMKSKPKYQQDEFKTMLDSLRKGKTTDNIDLALYSVARPSIQNFIMSICRLVPTKGIKRIKQPVLIIQGSTDLLVLPFNGDLLKKAKSDAELLVIKNMNHVLKDAPADEEKNIATYSQPELPLKPEFVKGVVDFVNKLK